ncbi:hypothetical protein ACFT7S_19605 [Streptomyces sp. NPDC057136]|uniref:hypothetical protein n=1 Tax=Streptomyces sp. NPDC057136 TaxID=3346029 RepID=UPI003634C697
MLELVEDAEHEEAAAPDVQEEITRWTRADAGRTTAEGIPDYAFGPRRHGGQGVVRDFAGTSRGVPDTVVRHRENDLFGAGPGRNTDVLN